MKRSQLWVWLLVVALVLPGSVVRAGGLAGVGRRELAGGGAQNLDADITGIKAETDKLDALATDGLNGTPDSVAYRVAEIERHLHSAESWFEVAVSPDGDTNGGDRIGEGNGAFQADAGNDDWGDWVLVLGSSDTPARPTPAKAYFDPHRIEVVDTERAATYFIQIGRGVTHTTIITNGTYTEVVYTAVTNKDSSPVDVGSGRAPTGSKVWVRVMCPDQDTGTLDFFFGIHEYEGN